jgi:hypothetical protein
VGVVCFALWEVPTNVKTKSNDESHVPTVVISQENICLNLVGEQDDQTCKLNNQSSSDKDQQKITALPSKRIRLEPSKRNKDFLW